MTGVLSPSGIAAALLLLLSATLAQAADIQIYTTTFCTECLKAKAYMRQKGIAFEERDVENNLDYRREFYARGGKGVPYLFVNGQAMHGFNPERLEALRRAGNEGR